QRTPDWQAMFFRMINQHFRIMLGRSQVSDPQRYGARRKCKCIAKRDHVPRRLGFSDAGFGEAYCLIRKPLQPQRPRKAYAPAYAQISSKAYEFLETSAALSMKGGCVASQNLLRMVPRAGLIAGKIFDQCHHVLAEQPLVRFTRCQIVEGLGK